MPQDDRPFCLVPGCFARVLKLGDLCAVHDQARQRPSVTSRPARATRPRRRAWWPRLPTINVK